MIEETRKNTDESQLDFLHMAINEAQAAIRAFDTKAQIVGIGYIFSVGIIRAIASWNTEPTPYNSISVLVAWFFVIMPIILFATVLHPSRRSLPEGEEASDSIKGLYNTPIKYTNNIHKFLSDLESSDLKAELAQELMKLSVLRDLKRTRFLRGLYAAGTSFLIIFILQLSNAIGIKLFA